MMHGQKNIKSSFLIFDTFLVGKVVVVVLVVVGKLRHPPTGSRRSPEL
jgi:hypothetical protein